MEPVELVSHKLDYGWGVVNHMNSVRNSDPLRQAHQKVLFFNKVKHQKQVVAIAKCQQARQNQLILIIQQKLCSCKYDFQTFYISH